MGQSGGFVADEQTMAPISPPEADTTGPICQRDAMVMQIPSRVELLVEKSG
jgi:hypothetical protein